MKRRISCNSNNFRRQPKPTSSAESELRGGQLEILCDLEKSALRRIGKWFILPPMSDARGSQDDATRGIK
jgi:hypothetical protein